MAKEKEEEEMPGLLFPEKASFRNEKGPLLPTPASMFLYPTVLCILCFLRKGPSLAAGTRQVQQLHEARLLPLLHLCSPSISKCGSGLTRPWCPYQSLNPEVPFLEGSIPSLLFATPTHRPAPIGPLIQLSTLLHHSGKKVPQGSVL